MREIAEIELAIQGGTEKIEQLGEQGKVDESMKEMAAIEALKAEKSDKEVRIFSFPPANVLTGIPQRELQQLTETSGASGHQKLRVCDVCGAYLSVLDSDRRLADHFGGKVRARPIHSVYSHSAFFVRCTSGTMSCAICSKNSARSATPRKTRPPRCQAASTPCPCRRRAWPPSHDWATATGTGIASAAIIDLLAAETEGGMSETAMALLDMSAYTQGPLQA